jgi:hypothetical protein
VHSRYVYVENREQVIAAITYNADAQKTFLIPPSKLASAQNRKLR